MPQISNNSLQYLGVNAPNPPNTIIASRSPATSDVGYSLGTIWVYESANSVYILRSVSGGSANWGSAL